MTLLAKIVRRGPREALLAAEAVALLGFFRVCLAVVPVRRILRAITPGNASAKGGAARGAAISTATGTATATATATAADAALAVALRVRWAVEAATRNSAAEFVCFPQTLAGYAMLRRRGVASTMVYGVARSPQGELVAHTWLRMGERVVLGGEGAGDFTAMDEWG